jgi:hypothetical protein
MYFKGLYVKNCKILIRIVYMLTEFFIKRFQIFLENKIITIYFLRIDTQKRVHSVSRQYTARIISLWNELAEILFVSFMIFAANSMNLVYSN